MYSEAIIIMREVLVIYEEVFGKETRVYATALHDLAGLLRRQVRSLKPSLSLKLSDVNFGQGKYDEAQEMYEVSLRLRRQHLGNEHVQVAFSVHSMAKLLHDRVRYMKWRNDDPIK